MTFVQGILEGMWARKMEKDLEGLKTNEFQRKMMAKHKELEVENYKSVWRMMRDGDGGEDEGMNAGGGVSEMLGSHTTWVYFGESATACGYHTLASLLYSIGIERVGSGGVDGGGDKKVNVGCLWRGMARSLKRTGRWEEAIDAGVRSLEVEGADTAKGRRMEGLVRLWDERGMGDELYEEEMEMDLGSVLDEYIVYEREIGGVTRREKAAMEEGEKDGRMDVKVGADGNAVRRRQSSLMLKREDKWKLLASVSNLSNISRVDSINSLKSGLGGARRKSSFMLGF